MSFNQGHFSSLIDQEVKEFLKYILDNDFILTLVGGSVRDYFLKQTLSKDMDFEIKVSHEIDEESWIDELKEFFSKTEEKFTDYKIKELKYCIYRVQIGEYELEFSSPRKEIVCDSQTHDYFTAKFISNLDYKSAFVRRDFSINAIGIMFSMSENNLSFDIIDPFNGVSDLKSKTLSHLSDYFYYDYVRFLRMIRFECLLGFNINEELKSNLSQFKLNQLSHYYLFYEFKKCFPLSDPLIFLRKLYEYIDLANLEMNETLKLFRPLAHINIKNSLILIQDDFLGWLSTHKEIEEEKKIAIISLMNLSMKKYRRYKKSAK
ncbi:MAG: hypothetical protein VX341_06925 [Bdellovibrionota bacterium]|nr:hypothetical protein [Bdellovibrionota bacterium]